MPPDLPGDAESARELPGLPSRRAMLLMLGGAVLAGCGTPQRTVQVPEPDWPSTPTPRPYRPSMPSAPSSGRPAPHVGGSSSLPSGVIPRARWAHDAPDTSDMNRMSRITHITIHHDALSPFIATDAASSEARLELIRASHRKKHWADIGYHYVVDRAGRVYEGRPVEWQGAHVKDHNEGNIGILCMGNFEVQAPSEAQLNAMINYVRVLRATYRVAPSRVVTHREWSGAKTLCPGINMQRRVATIRGNKAWA